MKTPLDYFEDLVESRGRELPDRYYKVVIGFQSWRERTFPWYYTWEQTRIHHRLMMEKFGFVPTLGDKVEDCRGIVGTITSVDPDDPDMVIIDDTHSCSLWHCCSLAPSKDYPGG